MQAVKRRDMQAAKRVMQAAKRDCNAPPPAISIYGYVGGTFCWINR